MKRDEMKMKLAGGLNSLADQYFGQGTLTDRLINRTLKILVKQNLYRLDEVLGYFADENGEIDEKYIMREYAEAFAGDGFVFDLRDYVKNDAIRGLLPNKALKITGEDIMNMFGTQAPPPSYESIAE